MDKHNTINGVRCTVANCTYHCFDNSCAARSIEVGEETGNPSSSRETLCTTYQHGGEHSSQQASNSLENNVNQAGNWNSNMSDGMGAF